jgi:hypothetical protein
MRQSISSREKPRVAAQTNQHTNRNRALAGVAGGDRGGWLNLALSHGAAVAFSITMTPKRVPGGLFEGGIPFS